MVEGFIASAFVVEEFMIDGFINSAIMVQELIISTCMVEDKEAVTREVENDEDFSK